MANNKVGFDYYNTDTDRYQDIRIKKLKKNKSCIALAVYDYILCEIYRVKGCYMDWNEDSLFDVAEYLGLRESQVNDIVSYCCSVGLFNKELLTSWSILTSLSIQKRYVEMSRRAKRNQIFIPKKINLLEESDIIQEESDIIQEECTDYSGSLPQRKVKESKVKESKGEWDTPAPFDQSKIYEIFFEKGLEATDADKFINHYKSHNWKTKDGFPIKNWQAKAEKWALEEKEKSSAKKENQNGARIYSSTTIQRGKQPATSNEDLAIILTNEFAGDQPV